jgi:NarL family two-component system sensor histidine kinase LiaS
MNIMTRQILSALGVAIVMAVLLPALVFFIFPLADWRQLWDREVMNLPFVIFLLSIGIGLGLLYGSLSGMYWKRQWKELDEQLYLLQQGRSPLKSPAYSIQEFTTMAERIQQVYRHMNEQVKLSQKMANEKAADQEKLIQEMISQERNRLARELHDSVSQQMFAASMLMSAITESQSNMKTIEMKQLKLVEAMIHQSQLEMRALLLHLRPVALHNKTLQEGIQELLVELTQKVPMEITWKLEPVTLDKGIEDHLFRIVQESVSNTLRHAKASSLEVLLLSRDELLILRVADNGVGFSVDESKTGSYGLENMYERAVEIGGTMKIISLPNQGTQLEVKIPLMHTGDDSND